MNSELLFEKFDLFADLPNAVARIRALVLYLAFSGKLLPAEKPWASKPLRSLTTKIGSGATPAGGRESYLSEGIPLIRSMNVHFRGFDATGLVFLSNAQADQLASVTVQPKDVLFNITGASIGRTTTAPQDMGGARVNQHVTIIRPTEDLDPQFLTKFLASPGVQQMISNVQVGATRQALTKGMIEQFEIPVPPVAEQKRIVAKVDELMALCDRLQAQQQERETCHAALGRASLARFSEAPTSPNLNLLFHKSYSTDPSDLRKSILTLAVQGKLIPQDPSDEPAELLIARIAASKSHLQTALQIAKEKPIFPVDENSPPFGLPKSWGWARLADVTELITKGSSPKWQGVTYVSEAEGVLFITSENVGNYRLRKLDDLKYVEKRFNEIEPRSILKHGDILMNLVGASIGRTALYDLLDGANINQAVALIRLVRETQGICPGFLLHYLNSPFAVDHMLSSRVVNAQPNISLTDAREFPVPIPPLAEQFRIVAKVDQLMSLVDLLQTQLATSRTTAESLLEALFSELTGAKTKPSPKHPSAMKSKTPPRPALEPLKLSTRSFVLRRFAMTSGYRSLGKFDCTFHSDEPEPAEASPICLVGLNGSGKSNLIEALAEVFCFLELINTPWQKVENASSKYRENRHKFDLEYTLEDSKGKRLVRVRKTKNKNADFFVLGKDGKEQPVEPGIPQLLLLPRRVIGYSSGLNETVSHPFLRTKTIYSEEVRDAAPPEDAEPPQEDAVFDSRTLYMDYESNAAVTISNFIFRKPQELAFIKKFTRVAGVPSFGLRFNRKRAGRSGPLSIVRLTSELRSYVEAFARCAGRPYDHSQLSHSFPFHLDSSTVARFRKEFKTAENLFMAMHKWSLLNALILSDDQRNVYLSSDVTKGALDRPPSVPPSDRVFNIVDLKLKITDPQIEIDYSGLSDGEHQFMQIFGTALLFSDPGTLFLFDEPESHFNPEWRTQFNLILNGLPNASRQEYVITTHSPFIVSGSREGNVYKFERDGSDIHFAPVDFETYGASFDILLKKLFSMDSLIDQSARKDLEQIIKRGHKKEMQAAVEDFAESKEKRRLYEALIQKEERK